MGLNRAFLRRHEGLLDPYERLELTAQISRFKSFNSEIELALKVYDLLKTIEDENDEHDDTLTNLNEHEVRDLGYIAGQEILPLFRDEPIS